MIDGESKNVGVETVGSKTKEINNPLVEPKQDLNESKWLKALKREQDVSLQYSKT